MEETAPMQLRPRGAPGPREDSSVPGRVWLSGAGWDESRGICLGTEEQQLQMAIIVGAGWGGDCNSFCQSPGLIGAEQVRLTREGSRWPEHNHEWEPLSKAVRSGGKVFNRGVMRCCLCFRKFSLRQGWKNGLCEV